MPLHETGYSNTIERWAAARAARGAVATANALTTPFLIHAISPAAMLVLTLLALAGMARLSSDSPTTGRVTNARAAVAPDANALEHEALGAALGGVSSDELTKSVVRLDFAIEPTYTATATATHTPRPTATPIAEQVYEPPAPPASQPAAPQPVAPPAPPPVSGGCSASMSGPALALFNGMNRERTSRGMAPLASHSCATRVGYLRATDMATRNYFSHTSPSGQTAFSLLDSLGVSYGWAGENIARNTYPGGQAATIALRDFMASPAHRDNILSTNFSHAGVGAARAGNLTYLVIVFLSS